MLFTYNVIGLVPFAVFRLTVELALPMFPPVVERDTFGLSISCPLREEMFPAADRVTVLADMLYPNTRDEDEAIDMVEVLGTIGINTPFKTAGLVIAMACAFR